MRAGGVISGAGGINESAAERFSRYGDVEGKVFCRNNYRLIPAHATVKGAVKRDCVCRVVVPCDVHFAIRSSEWNGSDRAARAGRGIDARGGEGGALVSGAREQHAAARRTACCSVPGDVNIVTERSGRAGV